jgi:hypothetical protein
MNRVWKHFFKNLAWPVGIAAYTFGSLVAGSYIAIWLGYDSEAGIQVSALVMIVLPVLAYLVRDMWRDAKRKVEWENKDMMRTIKGDDRSDLYEN